MVLSGSGSDADAADASSLTFSWDLNGDGVFGDAVGNAPVVSVADVQALICGGACSAGKQATISLRVSDPVGAAATATTTVTVARDFVMGISPSSALLVPGASTSFTVRVNTNSGFTQPVTLSAPGLPTGVTASFAPQQVTPNGTSILTLSASSAITAQTFSLVVVGKSGTITHQIGGSLDLEFGLVPSCFGTITGRVTDVETGLPLAGVRISDFSGRITPATTAADGTYRVANVALVGNNAPTSVSLQTDLAGYLQDQLTATAACGVVTDYSPALRLQRFGAVDGHVFAADTTGHPTGVPIQNAIVRVGGGVVATDAAGHFSFPNVVLGPSDNAPTAVNVLTTFSNFFSDSAQVTVSVGTVTAVNIVLVPPCTGSLIVRVIDETTHHPITSAFVSGPNGSPSVDSGGRVTLTDLTLVKGGGPTAVNLQAGTLPPLQPAFGSAVGTIPACGATGVVDIPLHVPVRFSANIDATVVDAADGTPVAGATITDTFVSSPPTDALGHVVWNYFLGFDGPASASVGLTAQGPGYWPKRIPPVTLNKDQTTAVRFALIPKHTASVEGFVRDADSGLPIANADVFVPGPGNSTTTDATGHYRFDGLGLTADNAPSTISLQAFSNDFWSDFSQVTLQDGVVAHSDITLVKRCAGATVRGRVLNAVTHAPIAGATVSDGGGSSGTRTLTDAAGRSR